MSDELDDDTVAAVRKILSRGPRRDLCPGCGRRELADDQELCPACQDERRRASKRDWWQRQGDYRGLLADGHRPVDAASKWLAHRLRKGAVPSSDVRGDAARAGIARRTLQRARRRLETEGRLIVDRNGRTTTWRLAARPR